MSTHLHLDLVGGLSGDMFIGAMLDTFPGRVPDLDRVIEAAGFPDLVRLSSAPHDDGTLTGTRFHVAAREQGHHHHRRFSEIRQILEGSALDTATRDGALGIFQLIADAEARVHGKPVEDIAFHEVGAWDSIADVVLAAHLIAMSGASSWSVSAVPAGRGWVNTAHGKLPVPAPATALLLEGFELVDDGVEGERVTPTGAAILKHLAPLQRVPRGHRLLRGGYGFGSKQFPGFSNVARVLVYETASSDLPWETDQVMRLSFDIDDQSPETLAESMEQLLQEEGVRDISQHPCFGKKGRLGVTLTLLVDPAATDGIMARCFELTSTLGVRKEQLERAVLRREEMVVYVNERPYRVKVAHRPGGATAKVEMADLAAANLSPADARETRAAAESLALEQVQ